MTASIFVSYASADRNHVERLVSFLEAHHFSCWVSFRDVGVGDNYQEAITRALRAATMLIVLVTRNANSSGEIQKELSLASRYNLLVIPLRMEDVELNDALAYELTTRQWVDLFRNWNAGCDRLASQLRQLMPSTDGAPPTPAAKPVAASFAPRRPTPPGSVFVPPRQLAGSPTVALSEANPAATAGAARVIAPSTPEPAATVNAAAAPARSRPGAMPSANRIIGWLSFLLFAAAFAVVLSQALRDGPPPLPGLFFWAILLAGCARLVGAILRATVRAARHLAPTG